MKMYTHVCTRTRAHTRTHTHTHTYTHTHTHTHTHSSRRAGEEVMGLVMTPVDLGMGEMVLGGPLLSWRKMKSGEM